MVITSTLHAVRVQGKLLTTAPTPQELDLPVIRTSRYRSAEEAKAFVEYYFNNEDSAITYAQTLKDLEQSQNGPIPKIGDVFLHHSGRQYTVVQVANVDSNNEMYPITISYVGTNGKVWAKVLQRFNETMVPYNSKVISND